MNFNIETQRFRHDLGEGIIYNCRAQVYEEEEMAATLKNEFLGFVYNLGNTIQYKIGKEFSGTLCKRQYTVAFVPCGICEFKLTPGDHCLVCIDVSMRWLEKLINMFPKFSEFVAQSVESYPHFSEPYRISPRLLTELRHTLDHEVNDIASEMMIDVRYALVCLESIGLMEKINAKEVEREKIRQAYEHLKENIHLPLAVDALADLVKLSPKRLKDGFRIVYGRSIYEVLGKERVNKSIAYLRDSNLSVDEISERVGFRNSETFTATFKRNFGHSPSEVRRRAAE